MKIIPEPLQKFLTEEVYDHIELYKAIHHTDEIPLDELREVAVRALKSGQVTQEIKEAVAEIITIYIFDVWKQGHTVSREGERAVRVNPYTNKPY
jgi:flagellar biosynthesis protein FliP